MNQLIRGIRPSPVEGQAQNKKGFSQVILLSIVAILMLAGAGGFLVLREKKMPSSEKTAQQYVPSQKTKGETQLPETHATEDVTSPIEPTPPPPQFIQLLKPKTQPELKPKSAPPISLPTSTAESTFTAATPPASSSYPTSPSGWRPPRECKGENIRFSASPVDLSRITYIVPMGKMAAGHVTPTDHGYIHTAYPGEVLDISTRDDVKAPADGYITDIQAFPSPNDYRMTIWHSCTVSTIFIHLVELAPEVRALTGELPPGTNLTRSGRGSIPVKAGQVIAKMRGGVDFSVHDTAVVLSGLVVPSRYDGEPWKIHTVDLFDYFAEPLRIQLRGKSMRTIEPRGGKIDYDTEGRLVGNWFEENTGGYQGNGFPQNYWNTHLSFAYHHINPTQIMISIPQSGINDQEKCNVCFGVYGVRGNAPDPKYITPTTGLVTYELVARLYSGGDPREDASTYKNLDNAVLGVLLVQMSGDRRIKMEAFPGRNSGEVSNFTSAARIYER